MTRTHAIRELIRLGELSHKELLKRHPDYPIVHSGEDSSPPSNVDEQIHDLLKDLPERDLYILLALMYVGRGDFDINHLKAAYLKMKDIFPSRDLAIYQMMGKAVLSEYLADAMDEVTDHHIDLDSPSFETLIAN